MKMPENYNQERSSEILSLFNEGHDFKFISKKFDLAKIKVRQVLKTEMILRLAGRSDLTPSVLEFKVNREISNIEKENKKAAASEDLRLKSLKISKELSLRKNSNIKKKVIKPKPLKLKIKATKSYKISKAYDKKRASAALASYREGHTLEQIGSELLLTRERIRQILKKEMVYELADLFGLNLGFSNVRRSLERQAEYEIKKIHSERREKRETGQKERVDSLVGEAKNKGIMPEDFLSADLFEKASGISRNELREYRPDIIDIIRSNASKRWSRYYTKCRSCGTTTQKHKGLGYCEFCYSRSPEFKEIQKSSHLRNRKKITQQQKEYLRGYYQRPEVILKNRIKIDNSEFGGNRERAIERDHFKCTDCGISREESQQKYGKDLFVTRIDNNRSNNQLDNLKTLCKACFHKVCFQNANRWN